MTYQQFIRQCQARQRGHIRAEQQRMKKARKAWERYCVAMSALNLHPLDRRELDDRDRQLEQMARDVPETHGDSATMRWAYEKSLSVELTTQGLDAGITV